MSGRILTRLGERVYGTDATSFEGGYGGFLLQNVAEFVDPFEKTVLRKRVDREFHTPAIRECQRLAGQVDLYGRAGRS